MCKVYGYCRVSTKKQSIARQVENIKAMCADVEIYCEAYTGTKMDRPEWNKLMKRVKAGDTIIFDEISRMSRQADEGYATYKNLFDSGVRLVFLKERTLDTDNFKTVQQLALVGNEIADTFIEATNKVLMLIAEQQIHAAFEGAQHEVDFLHRRTADGMKTHHAGEKISKARTGRQFATKKGKAAKAEIKKYSRDFDGTLDDAACMKLAGISRNSFYKYKRELKAEDKAADATKPL